MDKVNIRIREEDEAPRVQAAGLILGSVRFSATMVELIPQRIRFSDVLAALQKRSSLVSEENSAETHVESV